MPERVELIVRNGTLVTSETTRPADLAVDAGRFVAIAAPGELGLDARETYDATGQHVLPGVIDGHVHFRDPGFTAKEDWGSGSTAAVLGGVTTVLDMPNTDPQTRDPRSALAKRAIAETRSWADFGFIGLLAADNLEHLRPLAERGLVVGFKAFLGVTIGSIPPPPDGAIVEGMGEIAAVGMRIGFHAENNDLVQHEIRRLRAQGRTDPLAHVESRPVLAEVESIQRMGLFAQATGCPAHIFHLSSRQGLQMVEEWRAKGVDYTCETAPHYVFLGAEEMATLGPRLRVNPPVRAGSEGHADALLAGLVDGRVTMIATDHAPHTRAEKLQDDIWQAVSGIPGVETSVPIFLTRGVNGGRMTLQQYVRASSEGPARTWGLYPAKGAIEIGSDADLTIVDLGRPGVIRDAALHSKSPVTPYDGMPTTGAPVATIVRGRIVMREGQLVGAPAGRMVHRVA